MEGMKTEAAPWIVHKPDVWLIPEYVSTDSRDLIESILVHFIAFIVCFSGACLPAYLLFNYACGG